MIRLVHQFDSPRRRAAAASPKSEMCSCCCCCSVVTALATGIVTARAVGRVPRTAADGSAAPPPPPKVDGGPLTPETTAAVREYLAGGGGAPSWREHLPLKILGFLLVPICVALGVVTRLPALGVVAYVGGIGALVVGKLITPRALAVILAVLVLGTGLETLVWLKGILH